MIDSMGIIIYILVLVILNIMHYPRRLIKSNKNMLGKRVYPLMYITLHMGCVNIDALSGYGTY